MALDAIGDGATSDTGEALQDLYLAFNRGFTSGYLFGKRYTAFMGRNAPDNRGYCIGVVNRYDEKSKIVTIRSNGSYAPRPGDGLLFTPQKKLRNEFGFSLNTVPLQKEGEIMLKVPHPVETGTRVSITRSIDLDARARQLISHPVVGLRHPIPVDLSVTVDSGGKLVLEGLVCTRNGRKIPVAYRSDFSLVPARSHPLTIEQLEQQVKKTGGTPFAIRTFSLTYDGDLFAPLAGLNRVRREFLARAEEMLVTASLPSGKSVEEARERWNAVEPDVTPRTSDTGNSFPSSLLSLAVCTDSLEGVQKAAEGGCDAIYFEPVFTAPACTCRLRTGQLSFESQVIAASELCRDAGVRFVVKLPKITNNTHLDAVLPIVKDVLSTGISDYMVENCGAAHALMHMDPAPALSGSIGLNIFNHRAAQYLASRFTLLTLSPELSRDEIRLLIHAARSQGLTNSFALVVQGCSEAMVSEDCILQPLLQCNGTGSGIRSPAFFGIRDATGHVFPVRTDGECRSHIYNSAEICLIDHLPSLMQVGINEVIIDARGRPGTYTGEMTRLYRQAITLSQKKIRTHDHQLEELKGAVKRLALGGITAGHFNRGLKES
jgi:putative protease